ncbi:hypothetical protein KC887_00655 [Candidatus Kaiserbacteria bacterium]|nr:hypothetical protein [Candidatus Kaiserbacteria bacterium]
MEKLKFEKYWVSVEVYGHSFNVEIDITNDGRIGERSDRAKHWMPEFMDWEVVYVRNEGQFQLLLGVRRKGGKRTAYHTFDVRECNTVKNRPLHKTALDRIIAEASFSSCSFTNGKPD